jgi:hypothetical protein
VCIRWLERKDQYFGAPLFVVADSPVDHNSN